MKYRDLIIAGLIIFQLSIATHASESGSKRNLPRFQPNYTTTDDTRQWFEKARLGIFIHWGPQSNWERDMKDYKRFNIDNRQKLKRAQELAAWQDTSGPDPRWSTWNPTNFNAKEWVSIFRNSGAQYFTFTTHHKYGLANYEHPVSTYGIKTAPYPHDLVEQLAQAATTAGMPYMWYFNSDAIVTLRKNDAHLNSFKAHLDKGIDWTKYRDYGLKELVENRDKYGRAAGFWFDGTAAVTTPSRHGPELYPENFPVIPTLHAAQPWLIFNKRGRFTDQDQSWHVPEQQFPALQLHAQSEMTMPVEGTIWHWGGGKVENHKTGHYAIQILSMVSTRDSNLLMNISPKGDGSIYKTQLAVLDEVGNWLSDYGDAVYGTRAGPYLPGPWGGATRKGNKVFLHILQNSRDGKLTLPALPYLLKSSRLLNGGSVTVNQTDNSLEIDMDDAVASDKTIPVRIVELTVDEDTTADMPAISARVEGPPNSEWKKWYKKEKYISSNKRKNDDDFRGYLLVSATAKTNSEEAGKVVDDNDRTAWGALEPGDKGYTGEVEWLQLDLGSDKSVTHFYLKEEFSRIRKYVVQYKSGDSWIDITRGKRLNILSYKLDAPVKARYFRVQFLETAPNENGQRMAPHIESFHLYN